jgi:pilus assembly protein Flp/PilA
MLTSFEYLAGWMRGKFGRTERGAALVEYALLLALIAVVCIVALQLLGDSASSKFSDIGSEIQDAGN